MDDGSGRRLEEQNAKVEYAWKTARFTCAKIIGMVMTAAIRWVTNIAGSLAMTVMLN